MQIARAVQSFAFEEFAVATSQTTAGKNGGSPPSAALPDNWTEFPTLSEAANLINISRKRLSEFIKLGVVKKYVGPRGALGGYRIDPEDLHRLEEQIEEETAATVAPSKDDANKALIDGMKLAQEHARALVTLFEGPYQHVMTALREENTALRAELVTMRTERAANDAQREESRAARAIEAVALKEVEGEQETRREAVGLAKKVGEYLLRKKLMGEGIDPRLIALQEAMAQIPRESFDVLFKMGILPSDVEGKLKEGLGWKEEPAAAQAAAASSEGAPPA